MNDAGERQWRPILSSDDIAELMYLFGGFHDGCLREVHAATGAYVQEDLSMTMDWATTVRVFVQRQFANPSAIEMRFDEVVGLRLSPPPPNYDAVIYHAAFFIRDGIFYWADNEDWKPESPDNGDSTWVSARKVFWRDASNWLGPEMRYLADND